MSTKGLNIKAEILKDPTRKTVVVDINDLDELFMKPTTVVKGKTVSKITN